MPKNGIATPPKAFGTALFKRFIITGNITIIKSGIESLKKGIATLKNGV
jgi:hypothetical protein